MSSGQGEEVTKITTNMFWRFAERILAQLVAFAVYVVLARILDPDLFGTVALLTVFINILQVFVESGLGNALIQKKDADNLDFSTVFFTNVVFCSFLYLLLFCLAPCISSFYNDSALTPFIRVLGITVLISGVKNVQQAYVSRHMMFRKFFFATLGGTIVAGVVGILMALNGAGVWALVAQHVINLLIDTIILWIIVRWKPSAKYSFERLKGLFGFGWKLLVSSLIEAIYNNVYQLVVGKKYNTEALAYYNQGEKIPKLIVTNINTSMDSVLFPVMSNVQDEKEHLRSMTKRTIKTSIYILAPLMFGLAAIGEPLVSVMLTEKWLPAVPFLRIFCVTYVFYPIHTANLNALKAMGRSDLFLKLEIMKKVVGISAILITVNISATAIAYSLLVTNFICQIINSWPNRKLLKYGYLEQIKDILPCLGLALLMAVCVFFVKYVNLPTILVLIIQIVLGAAIYLGGSKILKIESLNYLIEIVKKYLNKKRVA